MSRSAPLDGHRVLFSSLILCSVVWQMLGLDMLPPHARASVFKVPFPAFSVATPPLPSLLCLCALMVKEPTVQYRWLRICVFDSLLSWFYMRSCFVAIQLLGNKLCRSVCAI
ncbi:uncharacterized protein LAESUDRAFT_287515 [Laetiporus sulphureus 93-53]|uniref:Uncharacterized protein n=1 Tax=Laetiporus sulphureus 93-53 TaxID=1314785 RepID=A0A165DCW7_9APHY|nr:uncharacterized protein LAESUDRAFT_287515 [Laetiporus sulphureus 93-53]KZT04589.1 hypothetical protein LAESUDRAFT_287515 [Laetiporus sulphureus 93-53]